MAYTETWDETKPAGTRDANLGDDDIREFKRAIRERLAGGGQYFPSTDDANAGLYNYVKFIEQSANPTVDANRAYLFTKDVSGITELYWMDSAGTVTQLSSGGKLLISSLVIASEARGDLIVRGVSLWGRLAIGAASTFLKSDGTDPSWAAISFQSAASQAQMEAATDNTVVVTPARAQYHPGTAKAWVNFNGTGVVAINASYNVTSITDNGTGDYTVNFTTSFSSTSYAVAGTASRASGGTHVIALVNSSPLSAGGVRFTTRNVSAGTDQDCDIVTIIAHGDQ